MAQTKPPTKPPTKTERERDLQPLGNSLPNLAESGHPGVPPRPNDWLGGAALATLVQAAVRAVPWENRRTRFSDHGRSHVGESLMLLEIYTRARGISTLAPAEPGPASDPFLAQIFPTGLPDQALRERFQSGNRSAIQACLLRFFQHSFTARFGARGQVEVPIDSCVAQALDRCFEPVAAEGSVGEATAAGSDPSGPGTRPASLERAAIWDGMVTAELSP